MTTETDAALLKREKLDRVYDFFHSVLSLDEATAMLMAKAEQDQFEWNSVRLTYGKDKKSALDPSVSEHYRATYPNIIRPEQKGANDTTPPEVDAALVAEALAGSLTAKGRVLDAMKLDPHNPASVIRVDAFLAEAKAKANGGDKPDLTHANNPFTKLRTKDGKIDPAVQRQVESMIARIGARKTAAIAASAGMTITGLPLR